MRQYGSAEFAGLVLLVLGVYFIPLGETVQNTLMCYQCTIHGSNESVCDNDLKLCPTDQAYDRCLVNIMRNYNTGKFIIIKRCALAPCEFEQEVEKTLGFTDKCILSRRDADCVKCCPGDGCNRRISQSIAKQLASTASKPGNRNSNTMILALSLLGLAISSSFPSFPWLFLGLVPNKL